MNYKDRFYTEYVSTHTLPRKGEVTLATLKDRAVVWGKTFGRFLPENKDARIIDLGCGYGSIVWWLQQAGFGDVEGIDGRASQLPACVFRSIVFLPIQPRPASRAKSRSSSGAVSTTPRTLALGTSACRRSRRR